MRLGEIWDYFMRRKLLLLSIVVALIAVITLSCRLSSGRTNEITEIPASEDSELAEIEIPKTGETVMAEEEGVGCAAETVDWEGIVFGNGENQGEEDVALGSEMTFWGAEAPVAMIRSEQIDIVNGEKIESTIITLGILATVVVLAAGKFIFDRYAR